MPATNAFFDRLAAERNLDIPDTDFTNASKMRRRLLTGNPVRVQDVVAEYGVSDGYISQVIMDLEDLGFLMRRDVGDDNRTTYTVLNPDHVVDRSEPIHFRSRSRDRDSKRAQRARKTRTPREPREPKPEQPEGAVPPLPPLGAQVVVAGVFLDGRVLLRNGKSSWLMTLESAS